MKKKLMILVIAIFLAITGGQALAKERMIKLTIPGCAAWGSKSRIGAILSEIKGVKRYDFVQRDFLVITYDDKMTSFNTIARELKKGGKEIKEKPVYLK